jgi:hypothetical protein
VGSPVRQAVSPAVNPAGSPVHRAANPAENSPAENSQADLKVRAAVPVALRVALARLVVFQAAAVLNQSRLLRVKPAAAVALKRGRLALALKPRAAVAIKAMPTATEMVTANLLVTVAIRALCPAA